MTTAVQVGWRREHLVQNGEHFLVRRRRIGTKKLQLRIVILLVFVSATIVYLLLIQSGYDAVTLLKYSAPMSLTKTVCQPEIKAEIEHVNPLLELMLTGKRVQSLPRKAIVATLKGTVGMRWNHRSIQHDTTRTDNIRAFNYEACPLDNADCVVTHPLPESIFSAAITYCLHDESDFISGFFRREGAWEFEQGFFIWSILVQDPELQFIDIGANIGASLMIAAKMGREVIAVEPLNATLNILCKSVIENDLTETVTIIPFAVSDERTVFKARTHPGNWGGTEIGNELNITGRIPAIVTSILTDDILKFINFRKAILKIDIEGHEPRALKAAVKLFEKVYIPVILMEWICMQNAVKAGKTEGANFVVDYFSNLGYTAYRNHGEKLDRSTFNSWGEDIYWLHDNYNFTINPWNVY